MCVCVGVCEQTEKPEFPARKIGRTTSRIKKVRPVYVQQHSTHAGDQYFGQQGMVKKRQKLVFILQRENICYFCAYHIPHSIPVTETTASGGERENRGWRVKVKGHILRGASSSSVMKQHRACLGPR